MAGESSSQCNPNIELTAGQTLDQETKKPLPHAGSGSVAHKRYREEYSSGCVQN
jgi:hypothetical protein